MGIVEVIRLPASELGGRLNELTALLEDSVAGGASIGFMHPLQQDEAALYWRDVIADTNAERRICIGASIDGTLVGVVQLAPSPKANQQHRADVQKLLVHSGVRRRGIATALMSAVEEAAAATRRWLLVLDTRTGSAAERLYRQRGWQAVGAIPDYACDPDGTLAPCTFFWKRLEPVEARP